MPTDIQHSLKGDQIATQTKCHQDTRGAAPFNSQTAFPFTLQKDAATATSHYAHDMDL